VANLATIEQQLSTAIGQQETAGGTTGVGASLNNPGGLKWAPWEVSYGAIPGSGGFAQFPSLEQGEGAMSALIDKIVQSGASLSSLLGQWAPASDNNPTTDARVTQLAQLTGLDPAKPILGQATPGALSPGQIALGVYSAGQQLGITIPGTATVGGTGSASTLWGRAAAMVVGLMCLGAGFLLLKETRTVIQVVGKTAAKGAAAVAMA
jgi:hypothetical protein